MKFIRNKPTQMLLYDVLLRRAIVEESVRREWETKFHALRTGYIGERRVDNEWREVNVQGTLLHDFTCRNRFGNTHQEDSNVSNVIVMIKMTELFCRQCLIIGCCMVIAFVIGNLEGL